MEAVENRMTFLSLGAGVQSSTLLLMACEGELHVDHAVFADTGGEARATYKYLEGLRKHTDAAGIPLHVCKAEDSILATETLRNTPPFFIQNRKGDIGILHRQCTTHFKIRPIERTIKAIAGIAGKRKMPRGMSPVAILKGISLDEIQRAKEVREWWCVHKYPLLERRMRRGDCVRWLTERGYEVPPRSACVMCPFRSDSEWRDLRDSDSESWREGVAFDRAVRASPHFEGSTTPPFVHRSLLPLDMAPIDEDSSQIDMFQDECEGMCGV